MKNFQLKKGFTLIEMMVVIGLVGLVLPVVFSIIFVILQQQTKIIRLSEVKRQGDFVLATLTTHIKNNVRSLHNNIPNADNPDENIVCNTTNSSYNGDIYFQDKRTLGTWSRFILQDDKIASESSVSGVGGDLTNDKVKVTYFSLSCQGYGQFIPPVVNISFTLQYKNNGSSRPEDIAFMTYQTKVKLRSY
ncbi:MAG: type II secretion system GspH family protein [Patescibacteria group bacterium]|nr:type II secretion system GspH family protein [Patescibacteria group bacterium]